MRDVAEVRRQLRPLWVAEVAATAAASTLFLIATVSLLNLGVQYGNAPSVPSGPAMEVFDLFIVGLVPAGAWLGIRVTLLSRARKALTGLAIPPAHYLCLALASLWGWEAAIARGQAFGSIPFWDEPVAIPVDTVQQSANPVMEQDDWSAPPSFFRKAKQLPAPTGKPSHAARNAAIIVVVIVALLVILFVIPIPVAFSESVASSPSGPEDCTQPMSLGSNAQVSGTFSSSTGQPVVLLVYAETGSICDNGTPLRFASLEGSGTFAFVSATGATYYFFATTTTADTVSISGTYTGAIL